ncbi:MAG: sigma-54-dependent Fis family transcriptional regulator [Fibrobacteres bacterium]|nr:sigma-54-dependent Fis family transcriptional regulator [Fibrobacterota bacterium]
MNQITPLLSSVLTSISRVHAFIKITSEGIISSVETAKHSAYHQVWEAKLLNRKINDFFIIPDDSSLDDLSAKINDNDTTLTVSDLFNPQKRYSMIRVHDELDAIFDFSTSITTDYLFLLKINDTEPYVGIIRDCGLSQMLPELKKTHQTAMWINHKGLIKGISHRFCRSIGKSADEGIGLLDKDITKIFPYNPLSDFYQTDDMIQSDRNEEWIRMPDYSVYDVVFKTEKGGLGGLLELSKNFNFFENDFKISLDLEIISGTIPCIIFEGAANSGRVFPDYCGYLVGPSGDGNEAIIKKIGIPFLDGKKMQSENTRFVKIDVIRRGINITYICNDMPLVAVRDPSMIHAKSGYQYLYSRTPSEIKINSSEVYYLPKNREKSDARLEIALVSDPDRVFAFELYPDRNDPLFEGIRWLVFQEFSDFRWNLKNLSQAEAKARNERDFYKTLVLEKQQTILTGSSQAMARLRSEAITAAQSQLSIVIEGETGTGKEVLARFIHANSTYKDGPLIAVDCASLPATLLESELFGHEKGAFTGAYESRIGKFESAAGGTLFLDEISNIPLSTQAKLLRFLQHRTFYRLGSSKEREINTRILCASNVPLLELVQKELFRADLYYRLNGISLHLLPLRERKEDILELALVFLKKRVEDSDLQFTGFTAEAVKKLMQHDWPGNVRELEQVIERATVFSRKKKIDSDDILINIYPSTSRSIKTSVKPIPTGSPRALTENHIRELLDKNGWVVKDAAIEAGISRITFFRKMRKFRIERP